jgi:UDP-3-O-[3-hydroxymyristoyl] glucosamine N-acyltransferase
VKLRELAERLECRLDGDGDLDVSRVAGIQDAQPGDVTFLANPKYEKALSTTHASAVILKEGAPAAPCAMLRAPDPYLAFARAVRLFNPESRPAPGVDRLGEGVSIGDRTVIHANVTIGPGSRLGSDCVIHSNVAIRERCSIGDRVILQNGVVVGSDGYGFARRGDGTHEKIPQVATVVIEDDVELGANSAVDRPAIGETRIKSGTKIDNLVHIAHGVTVGHNVLMAAQVGIAGSTDVEDDVVFGGQVGVVGHLTIGRGAVLGAQAGVTNSIDAGAFVAGYPAIDTRVWRRGSVVFKRLPELKSRIEQLEEQVAELTRALTQSERSSG